MNQSPTKIREEMIYRIQVCEKTFDPEVQPSISWHLKIQFLMESTSIPQIRTL